MMSLLQIAKKKFLGILLVLVIFLLAIFFQEGAKPVAKKTKASTEKAQAYLTALSFYIFSGAKEYADEFGRYPESVRALDEAGLLLKKPYNFYQDRLIPLDGSKKSVGDIWLELEEAGVLTIYAKFPERTVRTKLMKLPEPSLISPSQELSLGPGHKLLKAYYSTYLRRLQYYRATITREAFKVSKAKDLSSFKSTLFFPDLSYAKNLLTGKALTGLAQPGELRIFEKDGKVFVACYDEAGELIPVPELSAEISLNAKPKLVRIPIPLSD